MCISVDLPEPGRAHDGGVGAALQVEVHARERAHQRVALAVVAVHAARLHDGVRQADGRARLAGRRRRALVTLDGDVHVVAHVSPLLSAAVFGGTLWAAPPGAAHRPAVWYASRAASRTAAAWRSWLRSSAPGARRSPASPCGASGADGVAGALAASPAAAARRTACRRLRGAAAPAACCGCGVAGGCGGMDGTTPAWAACCCAGDVCTMGVITPWAP